MRLRKSQGGGAVAVRLPKLMPAILRLGSPELYVAHSYYFLYGQYWVPCGLYVACRKGSGDLPVGCTAGLLRSCVQEAVKGKKLVKFLPFAGRYIDPSAQTTNARRRCWWRLLEAFPEPCHRYFPAGPKIEVLGQKRYSSAGIHQTVAGPFKSQLWQGFGLGRFHVCPRILVVRERPARLAEHHLQADVFEPSFFVGETRHK